MATNLMHFWREREIPLGKSCLWRLGNLRLWIQAEPGGCRWAAEQGQTFGQMNASLVPNDVVPSALSWSRAALAESPTSVLLQPQLPDRPLVARLVQRTSIPSGEIATLYCLVPTWVRLLVGADFSSRLGCWPTRHLRGSWMGDNRTGVLGYALASPAGPDWEALPVQSHHLIVPLRIENDSAEVLDFERLHLFPDFLGIFGTAHELWTNEVAVSFRGGEREPVERHGSAPPTQVSGAKVLLEPVVPSLQANRTVIFGS